MFRRFTTSARKAMPAAVRFTPSARRAVEAAVGAAAQLGHQYVGTEHLLLGLLVDAPSQSKLEPTPVDPAATVLMGAGLRREYVRSEVVRLLGSGAGTLGEGEAEALQAIGIDLDAVRVKLEESFGDGVLDEPHVGHPGSRLPFTPRAKTALELSLREARQLGHNHLAPGHVLLGLIREGEGIAAQILAAKAPLPTLRQRLLDELERAA